MNTWERLLGKQFGQLRKNEKAKLDQTDVSVKKETFCSYSEKSISNAVMRCSISVHILLSPINRIKGEADEHNSFYLTKR